MRTQTERKFNGFCYAAIILIMLMPDYLNWECVAVATLATFAYGVGYTI